MDIEDDYDDPALASDEADAFHAVNALGQELLEYDAEIDAYVTRFKRDEAWRDALTAIRRLLKKYHTYPDLPARAWMAKLNVATSRLLPLITTYPNDKEMLYDVGKVLVFLSMPMSPTSCLPGTRSSLMSFMRQLGHSFASTPAALAALVTLLKPALDPLRREKTERDVHAVDLVLSLLKQLLEVPNVQDGASAPHTTESLVLMLESEGILNVIISLCKLVERREFGRLAALLLDLFFQAFRGQTADSLYKAYRAHPHITREYHPDAGSARGGVHTPLKPLMPMSGGAARVATVRVTASRSDALTRLIAHEKASHGSARATGTRHSRFGTAVVVKEIGTSHILAQPFRLQASAIDDNMASRKRRHRARARKSKHSELELPSVEIPLHDGVGSADPAGTGIVEAARAALFRAIVQLVTPDVATTGSEEEEDAAADDAPVLQSAFSILVKVLKLKFSRDSDELVPVDVLKYLHVTGLVLGCVRLQQVDACKPARVVSTKAAPATKSLPPAEMLKRASSTVAQASQASLVTEEEDASPPVVVSLLTMPAKRTEKPAVELAAAPKAAAKAIVGVDASQTSALLDRWSMGRLTQWMDEYITRKQWIATFVLAEHVKEVLLFIHALKSFGHSTSDTGRVLGDTLVDGLIHETDVLTLLPRLLRVWEPTRFDKSFVPGLCEATHYVLKLLDAAKSDGKLVGKSRRGRAKDADDTSTIELHRFVGEYAHPTIIQAYNATLAEFKVVPPRVCYYVTQLFKRIASLPNEYAGVHPSTGAPLTYEVILFHVSLLETASAILESATVSRASEHAETRAWAKTFCASFLRAAGENPLLFVEALFWRAEKSANAEVARHYGVLDGRLTSIQESADGTALPRKQTKLSVAAAEAEAEARRNAQVYDDDEQEAQFDDADAVAASPVVRHKGSKGKRGRKLPTLQDVDDDDRAAGGSSRWTAAEDAALRHAGASMLRMCAIAESLCGEDASFDAAAAGGALALRACAPDLRIDAGERTVSAISTRMRDLGVSRADVAVAMEIQATTVRAARASLNAVSGLDAAVALAWLCDAVRDASERCARAVQVESQPSVASLVSELERALSLDSPAAEGSDILLMPASDAHWAWLRQPAFTTLLRACGGVPPCPSQGRMWWTLPAELPPQLYAWLTAQLQAAEQTLDTRAETDVVRPVPQMSIEI